MRSTLPVHAWNTQRERRRRPIREYICTARLQLAECGMRYRSNLAPSQAICPRAGCGARHAARLFTREPDLTVLR